LDKVYNTDKSKDAMLDTKHLFQPRGANTGWTFRLKTPPALTAADEYRGQCTDYGHAVS